MVLDLAFVGMLTLWATGVGISVLRRCAAVPTHPADALALAIPVGLGMLAVVVLGLGELGILSPLGFGIVLAIGGMIGLGEFVQFRQGLRTWRRLRGEQQRGLLESRISEPNPRNQRRLDRAIDRVVDLVLTVGVLSTLVVALKPVTDGDALCYHLQVPKEFLASGSVGFQPDLHETVYPLIMEMLYAVALAFRGPVACRLIHWVLGLVFAGCVTALARPVLGRRARWAGTVALLVPAVSAGMAAPLNDVALAAFGNAALLGWLRLYERSTVGNAVLAGLLAGFALGVKYPALVWIGLLGGGLAGLSAIHVVRAWQSPVTDDVVRRSARTILRDATLYGVIALVVGGVWYLRAYLHTGNPVYPFFRRTFGGQGLDVVLEPSWRPLLLTPWNLLTALVPLTLTPQRFESLSHQLGPAFLTFLPSMVLFRPPRRVVGLVLLGWLFLTLCMTQRQGTRFLLIAVGPLSIGVGWAAAQIRARPIAPARMLAAVFLVILAFEGALALRRTRHGLGVVLGLETVEAYLSRIEPTYVVGRWIASELPASARLIGQDHRGFYFPRPYTMELAHRRRTGLLHENQTPESIVSALRRRGFTHLLMCPPMPSNAVEFDPELSNALGPWLSSRNPVYRRDLTDGDGVTRAYAIYDLQADVHNVPQPLPQTSAAMAGGMRR